MNNHDAYSYFTDPIIRSLFKPGKPVRHQQTCPVCGKKLVNTYRHGDEWKCFECWKAETALAAGKEQGDEH